MLNSHFSYKFIFFHAIRSDIKVAIMYYEIDVNHKLCNLFQWKNLQNVYCWCKDKCDFLKELLFSYLFTFFISLRLRKKPCQMRHSKVQIVQCKALPFASHKGKKGIFKCAKKHICACLKIAMKFIEEKSTKLLSN